MQHSVTFSLLLAGLLIQGHTASSQHPAFGIYFAAGTINCTPARGPSRLALSHTWLYEGDRITLADNMAEITLFDHDTSYIKLHGKGTYTTEQIGKLQHTRVRDSILVQYLSLSWSEVFQPAHPRPPARHPPDPSYVRAPRPGYVTSMDSLIFSWRTVYWARKYFLRMRNPEGRLCYDSVVVDTQAVVHFPGRISAGNSYTWTLDIVGESGRLQFADSGHIVLANETAILPQLPPITPDSIGGFAVLLQRIEQYENAGCTKEAENLFEQLTADFPLDLALSKLYVDFRRRNYF